jgi:hypothetical protein
MDILIPLLLAALVFVLVRLTLAVERLSDLYAKPVSDAYNEAVEEGYVVENPLPVGVYHANEDDANQYMFDKIEDMKNSNVRIPVDWGRHDESET